MCDSATQTIDLGTVRSDLEAYQRRCGYWEGDELRQRNAFTLSPSAYLMTRSQEQDIRHLSEKTYAAVAAVSGRIADLASRPSLTNGQARLQKLARNASRGLLRPENGERRIPPVFKVDLVQDPDGRYLIAEADVYNPRGFGYATWLEGSLPHELRRARRLLGTDGLACMIRARGLRELAIIVSEFERYYEPSFEILAAALTERGIPSAIVREKTLGRDGIEALGGMGVLAIPESMDRHPLARDALIRAYQEGTLAAFFPPVAYLGSKALLPYLRECAGMEAYIPETMLLGTNCGSPETPDPSRMWVLKAAVSSGLKKVYFSDMDAERFAGAYEAARTQKNPSWILQEQVPQRALPVVVFDEKGNRVTRDYYFRVTAYVSAQGLVDVEVTGRPDRKVHGAPDCIQIPVVLP